MEYVSPEGLRLDGRRPKELRQLRAKLGVLAGADGSAMFEMGNTKVLAAVFGPREPSSRAAASARCIVRCELSFTSFATGERRKRSKSDRRSQELASMVRNALEHTLQLDLLPCSQINVAVHVLQADGSARSAALNAATLAAADAGIPMLDMVTSCSVAYIDKHTLLDINYAEDASGAPAVVVTAHAGSERIVAMTMDNTRLSCDVLESVLQLGLQGCKAIAGFMRDELLQQTQRRAVTRGATGF